jgi:hypothetical protein
MNDFLAKTGAKEGAEQLLIQFELFELFEHLSYIYEHFSLTNDHMFYSLSMTPSPCI